jgi:hypothetical protein
LSGKIDGGNTLDVVGIVLYDASGNVIVPPNPMSVTSELGYSYPVVPEPGMSDCGDGGNLLESAREAERRQNQAMTWPCRRHNDPPGHDCDQAR